MELCDGIGGYAIGMTEGIKASGGNRWKRMEGNRAMMKVRDEGIGLILYGWQPTI